MPFLQATKNQRSGAGSDFADALHSGATDKPGGFYTATHSASKNQEDLSSVDGLLKLASEKGLSTDAKDIAEPDSLSFLQRLSSGLGALNPAEALSRDYSGTESFLTAYPKTVVQGIASALTGNDYGEQTKRRYFGDLVKDLGIENKYAQVGLGFVGDVLLDPSTYFGGTLMRYVGKGIGGVADVGLKGLSKVSPEATSKLIEAGQALKDAGGELFVYGYGASKVTTSGEMKALSDTLLEFEGKKVNVQKALAISNAKRFGTDVLSDNQWEEFLGHMFKGKTAEFNYFDTVTDEMLTSFNEKFPNTRFPLLGMGGKAVEQGQGIFSKAIENKQIASSFAMKYSLSDVEYSDLKRMATPLENGDELWYHGYLNKDFLNADIKNKSLIVPPHTGEGVYLTKDYQYALAYAKGDKSLVAEVRVPKQYTSKLEIWFDEPFTASFSKGQIPYGNLPVSEIKIAEFNKSSQFINDGIKTMRTALAEKLGREPSDIEVRSAVRTQTISRLESTAAQIPAKIGKLQALRDKLAQPFIANDLLGMKNTVSDLRKELSDLLPESTVKAVKTKTAMATGEQIDSALMNALSSEKDKYTKMILDLEAHIKGIESGIIEPAMKQVTEQVAGKSERFTVEDIMGQVMRKFDPTLHIKDKIVEVNNTITKLTNEMFMKQRILEGVLTGKQIAKDRIEKAFTTGDFSTLPEEVAHALNPVIKDPTVAKTVTERLARNAKLAQDAGVENPFAMYAPSIKKDISERQRLNNFFSGISGVKVGSKDYVKEFRNLLKEEELVKDRSLFLRVEDQVATNKLTEDFLKSTVENYGVPLTQFKNEQEAINAGYKLLKDKGIFGKEIGYVTKDDWRFLNSQMSNNYKAFDAIAKATGFDAATSLFKRFVTGIFAPFHVRNYASGEIQNYELIGKVAQSPKVQATGIRLAHKISQGAYVDITDPFDAAFAVGKKVKDFGNQTIELHGKAWNLNDIGKAIEERFGGSSRYNVDYNTVVSDADKLIDSAAFSKDSLKNWGKSFVSMNLKRNPVEGLVGENNPFFKKARAIGGWIEMQQKAKLVVGSLEKGMTMQEALDMAAKGGFDYRALTQFESKIMRRIIPFYSFNRKNVELQLRVLGENPQRINQVIRGIDNIQNFWQTNLTEDEKKNLPAYLNEYLSVPVGRSGQGVPEFIQNFGTPIEAFTQLVKFSAEGKSGIERTFLGTLSNVNPYLKVPMQIGTQKDFFRQRDLKEVYNAKDYEIAPQFVKDYLHFKTVVKIDPHSGLPRTTYVADPTRLMVMQSLFTARGFTYFTNVFNGDLEGFLKTMDLLSGIKVSEVDVERQAGFTERRKEEALGDLLRRNGVLSEFNKLFIPKQK